VLSPGGVWASIAATAPERAQRRQQRRFGAGGATWVAPIQPFCCSMKTHRPAWIGSVRARRCCILLAQLSPRRGSAWWFHHERAVPCVMIGSWLFRAGRASPPCPHSFYDALEMGVGDARSGWCGPRRPRAGFGLVAAYHHRQNPQGFPRLLFFGGPAGGRHKLLRYLTTPCSAGDDRRPAAGQLDEVGHGRVNLRIQSMARCAGLMVGCGPHGQRPRPCGGAGPLESTWLKRAEGRHGFSISQATGTGLPSTFVRELGKASPTGSTVELRQRRHRGGCGLLPGSLRADSPSPCSVRRCRSTTAGRCAVAAVVAVQVLPRRPASRRLVRPVEARCRSHHRLQRRLAACDGNRANSLLETFVPDLDPTCSKTPKPRQNVTFPLPLHPSPQRRCPAHASASELQCHPR